MAQKSQRSRPEAQPLIWEDEVSYGFPRIRTHLQGQEMLNAYPPPRRVSWGSLERFGNF